MRFCIKANAYGHGAEIVVRHLQHTTLCVPDVSEVVVLQDCGLEATCVVLSAKFGLLQ
ncbi:alanine racemase [Methylomicrobium sp. Wu6]|uniref:alanine racemase n=1 Tax=Methylomicrobium sp. Wu6 TaxID=3107928 RepID=UPI002DD69B9D|nr:alanine racemase [Methylomicrobium sp. Wu6]MEC4750454.1 alanine racemase [Methylomicrobium sp. Wu6]